MCPPHWLAVALSEVADLQNGCPFNAKLFNNNAGFPLLRIRDVGAPDTKTYYTGDYEDDYIVRRGDVVVGMDGEFRVRRWQGRPALLNQRVCRVIHRSSHIDERFLFTILQPYVSAIEAVTSSLTVKHLSSKNVAKLQVALPPLNEQRRIVGEIEALAASSRRAREALEQVPALLERFRQSALAAAFRGDLTAEWRMQNPDLEPASILLDRLRAERRRSWEEDYLAKQRAKGKEPKNDRWRAKYQPLDSESECLFELPAGWTWARTELVVLPGTVITYGIVLPKGHVPSGVPYIRGKDIDDDGQINVAGLRRTAPEIAAKHARSSLTTGDVLLCVIRHLRVAIVGDGLEGANLTQGTVRLRPSSAMRGDFLAAYLASPHAQTWMKRKYVGMAMPRINVAHARAVPIPVPPIEEQKTIANLLEALEQGRRMSREAVSAGMLTQERLHQSILAKAFRGELVPQDPNDEPASVLLQRIRADREAAGSSNKPKRTPRVKRQKLDTNGVRAVVAEFTGSFSFDDLRARLPGSYDSLRESLFTLLAEPDPCLSQVFDEESNALRFVRNTG
ncbi:restriction endonuclease subunit S [Planctomycetota bacterium]|nr:restriction endonuclease subunit S [Planctomycetota bacterium]